MVRSKTILKIHFIQQEFVVLDPSIQEHSLSGVGKHIPPVESELHMNIEHCFDSSWALL